MEDFLQRDSVLLFGVIFVPFFVKAHISRVYGMILLLSLTNSSPERANAHYIAGGEVTRVYIYIYYM